MRQDTSKRSPTPNDVPARVAAARWFVYLVRCCDGSLYCGIALDVAARIAAHNAGKGAKYTRSRLPVELAWKRRCRDGTEARKLEARIKRLTAYEKRRIVARPRLARALLG